MGASEKIKRVNPWSILIIFLLLPLGCSKGPKADHIFHNGTILTMAEEKPAGPIDAIAVKGEKILALGKGEEILQKYQKRKTQVHDLKGKTVLPGFISSHMHFLLYALAAQWVDVSSANTYFRPSPPWKATRLSSEIMAKVKQAVAQVSDPEAWIGVWAFDPSRQIEDVTVDRASLDKISTVNPILIMNNSGHFAYLNTKAMEKLNICGTLEKAPSEKCFDAHLTPSQLENAKQGILQEASVVYSVMAMAPKGDEEWAKLGNEAAKIMGQRGYTTVSDGGVDGSLIDIYIQLMKDKNFPLSVVPLLLSEFYFDSGPKGYEEYIKKNKKKFPPTLKIGPVKYWADGSPQGYSAFMLQAYKSRPPWATPGEVYRGEPNTPEIMNKQIMEIHRRGGQVAVHVNGDASLEMILDTLGQAMEEKPRKDTRHQLIHLPFALTNPNLKQLARLKELGLVGTFLSNNIYYWGQVLCQTVMGPERTQVIYPAKKGKLVGLKFSLHSDAPVNPPDPFHIIWTAVTRKPQKWKGPFTAACPEVLGPDQAISIEDGLKAFTFNAARQFFLDKEVGSLEEGKIADIVILDKNPLDFEKNPDGLLDIQVQATVHRGNYHPWKSETPETQKNQK